MLKEISMETAFNMYINDKHNISVLRLIPSNQHYCMYTFDELFKQAKFLIDDIDDAKDTNTINEESIKDLVDTVFESSIDTDEYRLRHTDSNDVRITSLNNSNSNSSKKTGKRSTIDLGKLYALKDANWKIKDIALELKCSTSTVNRYINNTELENQVKSMQNSD